MSFNWHSKEIVELNSRFKKMLYLLVFGTVAGLIFLLGSMGFVYYHYNSHDYMWANADNPVVTESFANWGTTSNDKKIIISASEYSDGKIEIKASGYFTDADSSRKTLNVEETISPNTFHGNVKMSIRVFDYFLVKSNWSIVNSEKFKREYLAILKSENLSNFQSGSRAAELLLSFEDANNDPVFDMFRANMTGFFVICGILGITLFSGFIFFLLFLHSVLKSLPRHLSRSSSVFIFWRMLVGCLIMHGKVNFTPRTLGSEMISGSISFVFYFLGAALLFSALSDFLSGMWKAQCARTNGRPNIEFFAVMLVASVICLLAPLVYDYSVLITLGVIPFFFIFVFQLRKAALLLLDPNSNA